MDDDLDLDAEETQEPIDAAPSGDLPDWARKEVEKARREAAKYRTQYRRSELAREYGDDVLELVPETLKLDEQKVLAAKLAERFRTATPNPTETVEEPEPPKVEVPAGLAAVARDSAPPDSSGGTLSAREIQKLMDTDPARGIAAAQAKYGGTNR